MSTHLNRLTAWIVAMIVGCAICTGHPRVLAADKRQSHPNRPSAAKDLAENEHAPESRLALERGLQLCRSGEVDDGLLWLVKALELAPPDSQISSAIRLNVASWERQAITAAGAVNGKFLDHLVISPNSDFLAAYDGKSIQVISVETGKPVNHGLRLKSPCNSIHFTPDGKHLLIELWKAESRRPSDPLLILRWDIKSAEVKKELEFHPPLLFNAPKSVVGIRNGQQIQLHAADSLDPKGKAIVLPKSKRGVNLLAKVSPTGNRLVAVVDNVVSLWDPVTGEKKGEQQIDGRVQDASRIVWSGDSKQIALATLRQPFDQSVFCWNVETDRLQQFAVEADGQMKFSVDGQLFAIFTPFPRFLHLFDTATGQRVGQPIYCARTLSRADAVSVSGQTPEHSFFVTVDRQEARVIHPSRGEMIRIPLVGQGGPGAVQPASQHGWRYMYGKLFDSRTGHGVGQRLDRRYVWSARAALFSRTQPYLFTLGSDKRIYRWRLPEKNRVVSVEQYPAAISDDGNTAITVAAPNKNRPPHLWNLVNGQPIGPPLERDALDTKGPVYFLPAAISPDGNKFAIWRRVPRAREQKVEVWKAGQSKPIAVLTAPQPTVNSIVFSPDGRELLVGAYKAIYRWNTQTWELVGDPLRARVGNPPRQIVFNPDGSSFVALYFQETQLWNRETGQPIGDVFDRGRGVDTAQFSPDGSILLTDDIVDSLAFDGKTGEVLKLTPATEYPRNSSMFEQLQTAKSWFKDIRETTPFRVFDFSPDGKVMACSAGDRESTAVQLRDFRSGKKIGEELPHRATVMGSIFSPDGKRLASWDRDGTTRVWNVANGIPVSAPLQTHDSSRELPYVERSAVAFSRNSALLATSRNHIVQVWHAATGVPIGPALHHGSRVSKILFSSDDRRLIVQGQLQRVILPGLSDMLTVWQLPVVDTTSPRAMKAQVETSLAKRLDRYGAIWLLDPSDWSGARR